MKSYINLIRHGKTEGNIKRYYYGSSDIPLAEEGKAELKSLVHQNIYPRWENADYYTSGMLRTEETLAVIYGEQKHRTIEELREMSFGEFEMKTHQDLEKEDIYQQWLSDHTGDRTSPGGESIDQFNTRILKGFDKLMGYHRLKELSVRHCGDPAISTVICHGGAIAAIMRKYFPGGEDNFYFWIPDPGHGYSLEVKKGEVLGHESF